MVTIDCCLQKVNITATNVGSAIAYNTDVTLHMAANVIFENASIIGYDTELIPGTRLCACGVCGGATLFDLILFFT